MAGWTCHDKNLQTWDGDLKANNFIGGLNSSNISWTSDVDLGSKNLITTGYIHTSKITDVEGVNRLILGFWDTTSGTWKDLHLKYESLGIGPDGDETDIVDLGSVTYKWRNLYLSGNLSDGTDSLTIANAKSAYTHSQDNTQAHSDYLLNSESDYTAGAITAAGGFSTESNIAAASVIASNNVYASTLTLSSGSIIDSTGTISFGSNNLTTTGTLGAGAITGTSLITSGNIGIAADTDLMQMAANIATINGSLNVTTALMHTGDGDTGIIFGDNFFYFQAGGLQTIRMTLGSSKLPAGVIINNTNAAYCDFQVKGTAGNNNVLYVDVDTNRVGVMMSNPAYPLDVTGVINASGGFSDGTTAGIDTTFLDNDGNTITVSGGIIISKVAP